MNSHSLRGLPAISAKIDLSVSNIIPTSAGSAIFLPLQQQNQQLYAVTDFKVKEVDVELGVGYGFTPGSDRLIFKAILGYAFPLPGKKNDNDNGSSQNTPLAMCTPRPSQNAFLVK